VRLIAVALAAASIAIGALLLWLQSLFAARLS